MEDTIHNSVVEEPANPVYQQLLVRSQSPAYEGVSRAVALLLEVSLQL